MAEHLTERNQAALDYGLGECRFHGPDAYLRAYPSCRSRDAARAAMARLLAKGSAQAYIQKRMAEIEAERLEAITYDREQALSDILRIKAAAMALDEDGAIKDLQTALKTIVEALKVQGKHPDQRTGALGPHINISINTAYESNSVEEIGPQPREISASGREHETVAAESGARTPTRQRVIIGKARNSRT